MPGVDEVNERLQRALNLTGVEARELIATIP
jgi:hypothetical protein